MMTGSVGVIGPTSVAVPAPVVSASALSSSASSSAATIATPLQNPRIIHDPTAGFITEYLSSQDGTVVAQSPTAITVAYLRQGLSRDGTVKESYTAPVATTA